MKKLLTIALLIALGGCKNGEKIIYGTGICEDGQKQYYYQSDNIIFPINYSFYDSCNAYKVGDTIK